MLVSSWLGYAENVLANSSQKLLSVHEILEGMTQTMTQPNLLFSEGAVAYATLAAALFSEIQNPESKFLRSGNKFTLRLPTDLPSRTVLSDRSLCTRRHRHASSRLEDATSLPRSTEPLLPVKLSTTTKPTSRHRVSSIFSDASLTEHQSKRVYRMERMTESSKESATSPVQLRSKQVRFDLTKNEVFLLPSDLVPFPPAL